ASWSRARRSPTRKPSGCPRTSRAASRTSSSIRDRSRSPSSGRRARSTTPSESAPKPKRPRRPHTTVGLTVDTRTERQLVARVPERLPAPPDWLIIGIGDDAAVVEPERNRVEVLTVDALVEGIHFDRTFTPPEAIGHRALAVNLSDLAAMGAAPRLALLSMALPAALPVAEYDAIAEGFASLARAHRVHVVGGNLARSPGPLMIDVPVAGSVKRRQALTRAGARAGDDVYVSGRLGSAAAGLVISRKSAVISPATDESTDDSRLVTDDSGAAL